MKFPAVTLISFKVIERTFFFTEIDTTFKGEYPKLYIQELWFLYSACHPMLINISMKFHKDILNGLKVIERTQICQINCYLQNSMGHNSNIYIQEL